MNGTFISGVTGNFPMYHVGNSIYASDDPANATPDGMGHELGHEFFPIGQGANNDDSQAIAESFCDFVGMMTQQQFGVNGWEANGRDFSEMVTDPTTGNSVPIATVPSYRYNSPGYSILNQYQRGLSLIHI